MCWSTGRREQKNLLFLTYEELKEEEPNKHVKRLAEFLGRSLSSDEIEQVVWKCSYERLTELDVNKREDSIGLEISLVHFSDEG